MAINSKVIGLVELREYLRTLPEDSAGLVKKQLGKSVLNVQKKVTGDFITGGGIGGDKLHSRTGLLRRSIKTSLTGSKLADLKGATFTDVIYAPIQEEGGVITAKNAYKRVPGGPYLNIPLSANLTAAGVMRKDAKTVFNEGGSLFQSSTGKWFVTLNGQLMFVLKKSVTIPARLHLVDTAEDEIPTLLSNIQVEFTKRLEE